MGRKVRKIQPSCGGGECPAHQALSTLPPSAQRVGALAKLGQDPLQTLGLHPCQGLGKARRSLGSGPAVPGAMESGEDDS